MRCFVLAALLSLIAVAQPRATAPKTLEDAQRLEAALKKHPDNLEARKDLLTYYFANGRRDLNRQNLREARRPHVLWLIEHHPEDSFTGSPYAQIDRFNDEEGYAQAAAAWRKQYVNPQASSITLLNAARFFTLPDLVFAEELLKRSLAKDPNNRMAARELAQCYRLQMNRVKEDATRQALATKAYEQMEAVARMDSAPAERFYSLNDLARMAYDAEELSKARKYANELIDAAARFPDDWNQGNAIHHGNLILGRLALREGQMEKAVEHLLAAGKTKGSPQLNSFGPNMTLALELLQKGRGKEVLQYFDECGEFWKLDYGKLAEWKSTVQNGGIPKFGANLSF